MIIRKSLNFRYSGLFWNSNVMVVFFLGSMTKDYLFSNNLLALEVLCNPKLPDLPIEAPMVSYFKKLTFSSSWFFP